MAPHKRNKVGLVDGTREAVHLHYGTVGTVGTAASAAAAIPARTRATSGN